VQALAEFTGVRDCTLEDAGRGRSAPRLWFADATGGGGTGARGGGGKARSSATRIAGCLRRDIGTCGAPCIGEARAAEYTSGVVQARAFLDGTNDDVLTIATQRMLACAERLEFERAASLRGRLLRLTWLHQRLQQFHANVDRLTFRYRALGADGIAHEYLVRRGTVRAERAAPANAAETAMWEAEARRVFHEADVNGHDVPLHDLDEFHLVSSWFRRRPAETARTSYP
ncbi:MAG: hypothetical protein M3Y64_09465, partial [Gemmatimonadota bacterium]|nr:hypothetical protein [Gemmatimonadota bacterium]